AAIGAPSAHGPAVRVSASGAGKLSRALRQVDPDQAAACKVHRPQPGSKERRMSPLLYFGGPRRRAIFELLLRVPTVLVGPRSHAAMGALEAVVAMCVSLDLELTTLCVALVVRSETVS